MIRLVKMNKEQISAVYRNHMETDFPANELKPLSMILGLMDTGEYDSLAVTEGEDTVGYVLLMFPGRGQVGLIDYLAIYPDSRNRGFGGQVLKSLKDHYKEKYLYLECEHPADAPDRGLAERRIGFYVRNGAAQIPLESRVFGAHYCHMVISGREKEDSYEVLKSMDHKRNMAGIYEAMIPDERIRKNQLLYW